MKIASFAIITILPGVLAILESKTIEVPQMKDWVNCSPEHLEYYTLCQPEWSFQHYIDFTGSQARPLSSATVGQKDTYLHLRVSKRWSPNKIYLTNDSTQKQTYFLTDKTGDHGLLNEIEPKETHKVRAKELHVHIKRPPSQGAYARPQQYNDEDIGYSDWRDYLNNGHDGQRTVSDERTSDGLSREHHSGESELEVDSKHSNDKGAALGS